jgi:hypothetical protein
MWARGDFMRDRIVQFPNRYKLTPVAGQADTYDLEAVPGIVTEAGTDLNKANLLSDATATMLGLTGDPTVNEALAKLSDGLKVAIGSYIGTGKNGAANPNVISGLSFRPDLLIVRNNTATSDTDYWIVAIRGMARVSPGGTARGPLSWGSNSVSWWHNTNAAMQLNTTSHEYYYMIFGR